MFHKEQFVYTIASPTFIVPFVPIDFFEFVGNFPYFSVPNNIEGSESIRA